MNAFVHNYSLVQQFDFLKPMGFDPKPGIDDDVWYTSKQISDFCGGRPSPDGVTNAFNPRGDFGRTLKDSPLLYQYIKQDSTGKKYKGCLVKQYLSFKNRSIECPEVLVIKKQENGHKLKNSSVDSVQPVKLTEQEVVNLVIDCIRAGKGDSQSAVAKYSSHSQQKNINTDTLRAVYKGGKSSRFKNWSDIQEYCRIEAERLNKPSEAIESHSDIVPIAQAVELLDDANPCEITGILSPDDLLVNRAARRSAMTHIDVNTATSALGSVKALLWAQWNGSEWMTTKQIADFLGISEKTVDSNYQRNKPEFTQAGEVQKLKGADLRGFREDTCLRQVSSKEPIIHPFSPSANIYSPQGVLRMSWISQSDVARSVRDASIALIAQIPKMIEQATINGRNEALDFVSTSDLSNGVIVSSLSNIVQNTECLPVMAEDIRDIKVTQRQLAETGFIMKERILSNCAERQIIDALHDFGFPHITSTESDKIVWFEWIPKNQTKVEKNIIYFIFADMYRRGSLTHLFSIGESGHGSERLSMSHERIKFLTKKQYSFRVFFWPLEDAAYNLRETRRQKLEVPLQQRLRSIWETQWDEERRKKAWEGLY